jgi:hypothetical protein
MLNLFALGTPSSHEWGSIDWRMVVTVLYQLELQGVKQFWGITYKSWCPIYSLLLQTKWIPSKICFIVPNPDHWIGLNHNWVQCISLSQPWGFVLCFPLYESKDISFECLSDISVSNAVGTVRADESQCPENSTAMRRLKSHVFCNYDYFARPVRQYNETVDVRLRLVVKKIRFVSMHANGTFKLLPVANLSLNLIFIWVKNIITHKEH